jgi:hypothetical protein
MAKKKDNLIKGMKTDELKKKLAELQELLVQISMCANERRLELLKFEMDMKLILLKARLLI